MAKIIFLAGRNKEILKQLFNEAVKRVHTAESCLRKRIKPFLVVEKISNPVVK